MIDTSSESTGVLFVLARYTSNGDLDKSFGGNGKGWSNITDDDINVYVSGSKILIEKDTGYIIVTGTPYSEAEEVNNCIIVKFDSSGILYTKFGGGKGYIYTDEISKYGASYLDGTLDIVLDRSNHIVLTSLDAFTRSLLLVGYNSSDGSIDPNFGENAGYTTTTIPNYYSAGKSVVIDSSNRIIVAGRYFSEGFKNFGTLLVRYSSSGKLDKTFGGSGLGYSKTSFGSYNLSIETALSLDNNGLFVVSGTTYEAKIQVSFIARYFNDNNEPICLPAGTPILTDQGIVPIDKIDKDKHTINHKRIVAITTTITPEKHLVCFEANSMGINYPSMRTIMTPGHEVLYKGKLVQAKHFVGRVDGVHTVPYNGKDVLYNVLQEKHGLMRVNGMVLETLHPENKVAKIILGKV